MGKWLIILTTSEETDNKPVTEKSQEETVYYFLELWLHHSKNKPAVSDLHITHDWSTLGTWTFVPYVLLLYLMAFGVFYWKKEWYQTKSLESMYDSSCDCQSNTVIATHSTIFISCCVTTAQFIFHQSDVSVLDSCLLHISVRWDRWCSYTKTAAPGTVAIPARTGLETSKI